MKKSIYFKAIYGVLACAFILAGCSDRYVEEKISVEIVEDGKEEPAEEKVDQTETELSSVSSEEEVKDETQSEIAEPEIIEADWSEYFDGLNGTAVVYDASSRQYTMYHSELAMTRRSPCSTFKIISSLIALENGIIVPEDSTRTWSGEVFWNEDWNKDIDFAEAFHASCVWYYREVIDDIGRSRIQEELDKLQYGNCDISDWEGRSNTNNNNRALTGFWIESSLMISPKEQVEVMERIFGDSSNYSEKSLNELKQVMLVSEQEGTDFFIYGKTGMGKVDGNVVDAWFTGFAESAEKKIYYCVYLGRTDDKNVSSSLAKDIAIRLTSDFLLKE